jgi:nucleoside-diphosphate-sugar epimerase
MNSGKISILGCGWLGVPLAKHLLEIGFSVKGSVTSAEKFELLRNEGILPFQVVLNETSVFIPEPEFFECDVLIISIPPRRIEGIERIFPAQISHVIPLVIKAGIRKVIFISSTSIYPDQLQTAREEDVFPPDKESGKALLLAENLLNNLTYFETTILRFGGLIGADRNPARFLQKSTRVVANTPVNLIHLDDCIAIIYEIIHHDIWGETLNACSPEHPYKKEFYGKAARISNFPEPLISEQLETYKIVDSSKLIRLLNYHFKYPSPLDYLDSLETSKK